MNTALKRCAFCRRRFHPHPQTAKIQKACSRATCRRLRHRLACLAWNKKHPDYNAYRRVKVQAWARGYPQYWQCYRATHSAYRKAEQQRMHRRRRASQNKTL
jgi:hypothetical protein